jgi:hypothetical protein
MAGKDARWYALDSTVIQPTIKPPDDILTVDLNGNRGIAIRDDGKIIGIVVIGDQPA